MKKKNIHVVPHDQGWAIKREGSTRSSKISKRKTDANTIARDMAKKDRVELVIHRKDGRIQDKDSFGNDPCPPKDTKH